MGRAAETPTRRQRERRVPGEEAKCSAEAQDCPVREPSHPAARGGPRQYAPHRTCAIRIHAKAASRRRMPSCSRAQLRDARCADGKIARLPVQRVRPNTSSASASRSSAKAEKSSRSRRLYRRKSLGRARLRQAQRLDRKSASRFARPDTARRAKAIIAPYRCRGVARE